MPNKINDNTVITRYKPSTVDGCITEGAVILQKNSPQLAQIFQIGVQQVISGMVQNTDTVFDVNRSDTE